MYIKKVTTAVLLIYVLTSAVYAIGKEAVKSQRHGDIQRGTVISSISTAPEEAGSDLTADGTVVNVPSVNLQPDRVIIYYFHRNLRCVSCIEVEEKMHEVIGEYFRSAVDSGILEVQTINFDLPENEHFIEQYNLYYSGLVFVEIRSGVEVGWDDFAEVWTAYGNDEELVESLRSEISKWVEAVNPS